MKHNRLLRWLFQRSKPTQQQAIAVPSAWYIDRRRAMIGDDLDAAMDISEQPTAPMERLDANVPAYGRQFYAGETEVVSVSAVNDYRTSKIPVLK